MCNSITIIPEIICVPGRYMILNMTCFLTWHVVCNLLSNGQQREKYVCVCVKERERAHKHGKTPAIWKSRWSTRLHLQLLHRFDTFQNKKLEEILVACESWMIQPLHTFLASFPLILFFPSLQPHSSFLTLPCSFLPASGPLHIPFHLHEMWNPPLTSPNKLPFSLQFAA